MSGWVKLWRKSLGSGLMQDLELWGFWCWCLLKASRKDHKQMVGGQMIELKPGQFVFGRKKASQELNVSEKKIRTFLKKLEKLQNVAIKRTNKFSIISINNWDVYQSHKDEEGQQKGQQGASKGPARGHKQEEREEREEKKKKEYTVEFEKFWSKYPNKKCGKSTAFNAWKKQNGSRPPAEDLISILENHKSSEQWQRDGGQYIPMATTWLNQKRWEAIMDVEVSDAKRNLL